MSHGSKSGPLSSTQVMSGGSITDNGNPSIQARKSSQKLPNQKEPSNSVKGLSPSEQNSLENKEKSKKAETQKDESRKAQQLNFYQPSEGSSENLKGQSVDLDENINESGEIIYQQNVKKDRDANQDD